MAGMLSIRCSTTASALLALQRFRARQGPERPLHAVAVEDEGTVIFDARVEGYAPDQVAGAWLGDRHRRAGQCVRHWGSAPRDPPGPDDHGPLPRDLADLPKGATSPLQTGPMNSSANVAMHWLSPC